MGLFLFLAAIMLFVSFGAAFAYGIIGKSDEEFAKLMAGEELGDDSDDENEDNESDIEE